MTKLTTRERYAIETLYLAGFNPSKIAKEIDRHKSTVTRELYRNSEGGVYRHDKATLLSKRRKSSCGRIKLSEDNWTFVRVLLYMKWSPEQISGWLKQHQEIGFYVSDQWIYNYINKNREEGGDLYTQLRRGGRSYKKNRQYRESIKGRVSIESRPEIVANRLRIGDWEVDSVIGKLNKSSLVTLVERVSRYTAILKVNSKESEVVAKAIIQRAKELNMPIHTITGDNGTEFADHTKISEELGIDFYFTHPYSSWEKGTNENTNGLIRQYFPKGTDFRDVSDSAIKAVENELNNRPRKCLNYRKPADILKKHEKEK